MPYIFGYGSLIEQASRLRSTPSALYVLPVRARAPFTVPAASKIDKLLETHLPTLFAEIQLAPGRW